MLLKIKELRAVCSPPLRSAVDRMADADGLKHSEFLRYLAMAEGRRRGLWPPAEAQREEANDDET